MMLNFSTRRFMSPTASQIAEFQMDHKPQRRVSRHAMPGWHLTDWRVERSVGPDKAAAPPQSNEADRSSWRNVYREQLKHSA